MPAASGASPPATPPAAASGMCGGAPCCVAAAGSDVAAAGAGPGSVAARAKNGAQLGLRSEQERVRAAVLSTASSRCGLLGLALDEIFSLASRLRWLAPKSFLSVRFSCFSSKRPNSAAMTDVGAARVRREAFAVSLGFGVSQNFFGGARDGLRPKERVLRMQNLMFFHTRHRHRHRHCAPLSSRAGRETRALTSPVVGARHAAIAPPCADMVRAEPPPPLALEERRAAARSRSAEREFGGQGLA